VKFSSSSATVTVNCCKRSRAFSVIANLRRSNLTYSTSDATKKTKIGTHYLCTRAVKTSVKKWHSCSRAVFTAGPWTQVVCTGHHKKRRSPDFGSYVNTGELPFTEWP